MSYVRIWVHAVWGTKNRQPILSKEKRGELYKHIRENAKQKEIYIDRIGGYTDHVHCLIALNAEMSIAKTIQLIKGEASFWANKHQLFGSKLEWADEYYAASVSEADIERVRHYIVNQESHHGKTSYVEECTNFLKEMGYVVMAKAGADPEVKAPTLKGGVSKSIEVI